jgi:small subunit ribosomal protein S17
MTTEIIQNNTEQKSGARILNGVVVSVSMRDTVVVEVVRHFKHPRYGKYVRNKKKYLAHDSGNKHAIGDRVKIRESKPISKRKRFIVQ